MSSLREMAEQAATGALPCQCDEAYTKRGLVAPDCPQHQHTDDVADAIERVAREFAERVGRRICEVNDLPDSSAQASVAVSFAAAERGE